MTIRELYDSVDDPNKVCYDTFREKYHRLIEGNRRTTNAVYRRLGLPLPQSTKNHTSSVRAPFLAYDGEGWGNRYVLLSNSLGERVSNPDGLSTKECLDFLSRSYGKTMRRIFFAFGYDVNHIIHDLPDESILTLIRGKTVSYEGHRISYIPGKIFTVNGYRYYDVFGFFQQSFVNVVEKMLGKDRVSEQLLAGKQARGTFETWKMDDLITYNDEELQLLVEVMNVLASAFEEIGVHLTQWYGPGAVAKYWFKEHNVIPRDNFRSIHKFLALTNAYFGGRFEQLSLGRIRGVYEYDIHSAYPAAIATMPYFTSWSETRDFVDNEYSVWHVSFDLRSAYPLIGPLPVRTREGRIAFPLVGKGWYWYPEVKVLLDRFPNAKITIHSGYVAKTEGQPFAWVKELYNYRQELKKLGKLSELCIKLGLNSLYGKMAQKVGRNPYYSVAWAGYITSKTRATLARAAYAQESNIIGFATDALFSTVKLDLPISENLGDWEESYYDNGLFFQSGVYRLTKTGHIDADGNVVDHVVEDRYRGSPLRHGIDDIIEQIRAHPRRDPEVKISRFISHLLSLRAPAAYGSHRLEFVQVRHKLQLDAPYKRFYRLYDDLKLSKGKIVTPPDYSKLLSYQEYVRSYPKLWASQGELYPWTLYDTNAKLPQHEIESVLPQPTDRIMAQLLDEGENIALFDEGLDDMSMIDMLPLVEEEMS